MKRFLVFAVILGALGYNLADAGTQTIGAHKVRLAEAGV